MRSKRKKLTTAVGATALAVAIALTGTFAWQSISQQAKNCLLYTSGAVLRHSSSIGIGCGGYQDQ